MIGMFDNKEIIFVRNFLTPSPSSFEIKLANNLKNNGFKLNAITFQKMEDKNQEIFDKNYYIVKNKNIGKFKKLLYLPRFIFKIRKIKNSIFIGISQPNWFIAFIFLFLKKKNNIRIYFPYDIAFFRFKDYSRYPWHERYAEKYNFRNCDGIIHKGPEEELTWLPDFLKAEKKPQIQFLPYCDSKKLIPIDNKNIKKISKKDGGIHLVYVGRVIHKIPKREASIDAFKEIVQQEIHIHVYALNYKDLFKDEEYVQLQKNPYFHLYPPDYSDNFLLELSKYDWGFVLCNLNFDIIKKEWAKTAFGNKLSSHLEAGLPSIVTEELPYFSYVIKKYNFGISLKSLKYLKKEIQKKDYSKLQNDIRINREKFTMEYNIDRLINFFEKL